MRSCDYCHTDLPETFTEKARFCDRRCKEQARSLAQRQRIDAVMAARSCLVCGKSLAGKRSTKAKCCSKECSVQWQNDLRSAEQLAARIASLEPCRWCKGPIDLGSRKRATKYCSAKCKHDAHAELYRIRYRHRIRERVYGLDEGQFLTMLEAQDNRCAICRSDEWSGKENSPHVDHDHKTGAVRGLLCGRCNTGVGQFEDDPARLRAAADYLEARVSI